MRPVWSCLHVSGSPVQTVGSGMGSMPDSSYTCHWHPVQETTGLAPCAACGTAGNSSAGPGPYAALPAARAARPTLSTYPWFPHRQVPTHLHPMCVPLH